MSTPSKNLQTYAENMASILDNLKSMSELILGTRHDFDDVVSYRADKDIVCKGFTLLAENANRTIELTRKSIDLINRESPAIRDSFLFAEEEIKGLHKPDNITINTAMRHKSPPLTARIGYEEAKNKLARLTFTDNENKLISARHFNKCFGFTGTEAHFVEFWREARINSSDGVPVKTACELPEVVTPTGKRGFKFDNCMDFLKCYYNNYHIDLILGKIKAISKPKVGKIVKVV